MKLLPALLSHYRRHPLQLIALVVIVVLATGLWTGVWELTRQARHSMEQSEQAIASRYQVVRTDAQPVTVADFVGLRRQGLCVTPWLEVRRPAPEGQVIGVDILSMGCFQEQGEMASPPDLNQAPFVDIGEAVRIAGQGHDSRLRLLVASAGAAVPDAYRIRPVPGGLSTGELADSFLLNLDALCVLVLLITALLVRSVYNLGLVQRRSSLALLLRYGVPAGRLRLYLIGELAVLAMLAAVPGVMLGRFLSQAFAAGFGQAMGGLFDVSLYAGGNQWISYLLALLAVFLVVIWCALDALGLAFAKGQTSRPGARFYGMFAVVLILAGVTGTVLSQALWQVFVAVSLVLVGTGLLTPGVLSRLVDWLAVRGGSPLILWSRRELAVMLRRLALPAVALQLAVATVIAIQALVATFESTFLDWLEQRLQGDVYIEVPAGASLRPALDYLAEAPEVTAWHRVQRGVASLGGRRADLLALDPGSELLQAWAFIEAVPEPWSALAGGGVMVNEQLARRENLEPGDVLSFSIANASMRRPIVAVYADYGRPVDEILLPHSALPDIFTPTFSSLSVQIAQNDVPVLRQQLTERWQVKNLTLRDNDQVRQLARGVFEQTFSLTRAISVLTLILAGCALFLMGWVFFTARHWYYQLLQVWGLSRRELRWRLQLQATGLTLLVAIAALPPGIFLTWVLVARINPLAFGWSLPMAVYPLFWLEMLAICGAIGLAIAWLVQGTIKSRAPAPLAATHIEGAER
ncbi:MAG: hypothetical protein KGY54_00755 [Oleiphilaceae bacterium]|nr:hypothetical protein [Oleiphilaceae bacterium]